MEYKFTVGSSESSAIIWGPVTKTQEELAETIRQARAHMERIRRWSYLQFLWYTRFSRRYQVLNGVINILSTEELHLTIRGAGGAGGKKRRSPAKVKK